MTTRLLFIALALLLCPHPLRAADTNVVNFAAEFERANKFYEQGKYAEAIADYENLIGAGARTPSVWFNLGNAAYKSGQLGRAIAAYRMAERQEPRDDALRANLQFVRTKVYSDERTRLPAWVSVIRLATLNEWTLVTASLLWILFGLLACGELLRKRFPKAMFGCVILCIPSALALGGAWYDQTSSQAIVTAKEATARFGPLDESQSAFQLRDGAELTVQAVKGEWLEVRDAEKRVGWIRRDAATVLPRIQASGTDIQPAAL